MITNKPKPCALRVRGLIDAHNNRLVFANLEKQYPESDTVDRAIKQVLGKDAGYAASDARYIQLIPGIFNLVRGLKETRTVAIEHVVGETIDEEVENVLTADSVVNIIKDSVRTQLRNALGFNRIQQDLARALQIEEHQRDENAHITGLGKFDEPRVNDEHVEVLSHNINSNADTVVDDILQKITLYASTLVESIDGDNLKVVATKKIRKRRSKKEVNEALALVYETTSREYVKESGRYEDVPVDVEVVFEGHDRVALELFMPLINFARERLTQLKVWRNNGVDKEERDYIPRGSIVPFDHQWVMYKYGMTLPRSANLSQMGTGKTFGSIMVLDKRIALGDVRKGKALVVAPNNILVKWKEDIETFAPHLKAHIIDGSFLNRSMTLMSAIQGQGDVDVFITNYEAFHMTWATKRAHSGREVDNDDGRDVEDVEDVEDDNDDGSGNGGGNGSGNGGGGGGGGGKQKKIPLSRLFGAVDWDMLILDEGHKIKNPDAKRTKNMIKDMTGIPYVIILSGTINANKLYDLFIPFFVLNRARNFSTLQFNERERGKPFAASTMFEHFKIKYFQGSGWKWEPRVGTVEELRKFMEEISVRFEKSECLTLPSKMYETRKVILSPKHRELYEALKNMLLVDLQELVAQGGRISTSNVLAVMMKLAEAANGWLFTNDGQLINLPWNPKLDEVMEVLDEIGEDHKVVIWSRFTNDLHLIADNISKVYGSESVAVIHGGAKCSRCGSSPKERWDSIKEFNSKNDDSKLRYIVANTQCGSHGIDLVGASYEIFFSNSFVKTDRVQAEDRCHRIGMQDSLTIIDIAATHTIDEQVIEAIKGWKSLSRALLEHFGVDLPTTEDPTDPDSPDPDDGFGRSSSNTTNNTTPKVQATKVQTATIDDEAVEKVGITDEIQNVVRQGPRECFLATIAMLTGNKLEIVKRRALWMCDISDWNTHATLEHCIKILRYYLPHVADAYAKYHDQFHATRLSMDDVDVPQRGLGAIIIKFNEHHGGGCHIVALQNGIVYDPSFDKKMPFREYVGKLEAHGGMIMTYLHVREG